MKRTTFLTTCFLSVVYSATALPIRQICQRSSDQPRLLHTFSSYPILSSTGNPQLHSSSQQPPESTTGGATLTLPPLSSNNTNSTSSRSLSLRTTFRIPHAFPPTTGPTAGNTVGLYAASFWIGLDSLTHPDCLAAVRAGVDIFWDGTLGGELAPFVWCQFGRGQAGGMPGFKAAAGDVVRFWVDAGVGGFAVVGVENWGPEGREDEGQDGDEVGKREVKRPISAVKKVFKMEEGVGRRQSEESGQSACGLEVAWIVEDFPLVGGPGVPVALANFTSISFEQIGVARGSESWDATGAEVRDVWLNAQGGRLTRCKVVEGSEVKCLRVVGDQ
ncbi:uncharacterized protein CTHT_0064970 [Thermochaetoides thermophila DSM 1495]|uniref:Uncharacterized protein n=1 Tax=Chaetomium thermophilum (strain DSM 1495 / CBS 144.50 / IMI 039719) TaxID=759272 RepID=G0SG43_CHATD|nr:hypothetical protein CTHT_0064970 [Thermochaetoides thermophila DSM 1495]EGS17182.1 hypothetical protein CTHT_0064970 [Thermochaetoides thermophila DSM 1495]